MLIFLSGWVIAQVDQPARIELPVERGLEYTVASASEKGLFLFRRIQNTYKTPDQLWEFIQLDTALNIQWKKEHFLPRGSKNLSHCANSSKLYLLVANDQQKNNDLKLFSFDLANGNIEYRIIKNFIPFSFFDFRVFDQSVLIAGHINSRPLVFLSNLDEDAPIVLPGLFHEKTELVEIKAANDKSFDVTLRGLDFQNNNTFFVNTFDYNGKLVKQTVLNTNNAMELLGGRSESIDVTSQLVAGVYGSSKMSKFSKGVFAANINEYGDQKMQFYNYGDLKNFFQYMPPKKEQRVLNKIARKKDRGKTMDFNYRLIVHDLIKHDDQYILLGEAFCPKYRRAASSSSYSPLRAVNRGANSRGFDGYKYTHAVVLGFDKMGNLLWDNSFKINDVISFKLEQFVQAHVDNDKISLLYAYNNVIRSKIIRGSEVLRGKEISLIKSPYTTYYKVQELAATTALKKWYGDVFYACGMQTINKSIARKSPHKGQVFFINKVVPK